VTRPEASTRSRRIQKRYAAAAEAAKRWGKRPEAAEDQEDKEPTEASEVEAETAEAEAADVAGEPESLTPSDDAQAGDEGTDGDGKDNPAE